MDFGVVLQTNPPASGVIAMMQRAEEAGFSYGWTWDSHVLWQEPFVIYSRILAATSAMTVGPMVTNPGTRDWSVIASLFATLNDMYGNRTVCGIGRGDSARRVIGQQPMSLATISAARPQVRSLRCRARSMPGLHMTACKISSLACSGTVRSWRNRR